MTQSTIHPSPVCPECGKTPAAESPQGLCPVCLMKQVVRPTRQPEENRPSTPSLSELAVAFPQLEVLELIGHGGMGTVFRARQPNLGRLVALKVIPAAVGMTNTFAERFEREGRLLARLHHPNIVTLYDAGRAGGFFYLLMEYVDGVNLRQAMRAGRFTPTQALGLVPQICDALQYAHEQGVLHRDIKPENILLDARGRVKLADFGIAKLAAEVEAEAKPFGQIDTAGLTQAGVALGTPRYMAPEQANDPQSVDNRADIYSLGVVFYELLTGELPPGAVVRPSEKAAVDRRVDAIVQQALERERELRQRSAQELKTQIAAVESGGVAKSLGGWKMTVGWALATTVALAMGFGLAALRMRNRAEEQQQLARRAAEQSRQFVIQQEQHAAVAGARAAWEAARTRHAAGMINALELGEARHRLALAEAGNDLLKAATADLAWAKEKAELLRAQHQAGTLPSSVLEAAEHDRVEKESILRRLEIESGGPVFRPASSPLERPMSEWSNDPELSK
jgi:serine/threonine protein kinase